MKYIELSKGYKAIVDDDDYEYLNNHKWLYSSGYAEREIGNRKYGTRKHIRMHNVILENKLQRKLLDREICDHINHNKLDNRKENLRAVSYTENAANALKRVDAKTSKYKGVYIEKRIIKSAVVYKYRAVIRHNGIIEYSPRYDDEISAAEWYNQRAQNISCAVLNDIDYTEKHIFKNKNYSKHKIICINNNKIYNSVAEAANELNISRGMITRILNHRSEYVRDKLTREKLYFAYYEE